MNNRSIDFVTTTISLIVISIALLASADLVAAQEAEIEAVREKIEVLLKEAERLQDNGAADKAERLVQQAQELKARLAEANKQRPRKSSDRELGEILRGLKAGAASLRTLGRADAAERLERTAAELQKTAADGGRRTRGPNEREVALRQIKIMRIAVRGLLNAGRRDSAHLMELAIHAMELDLEGVRNEKAARVRKSAPNLGQRVELLMFAASKLREAGKLEQASAVANLGEQLLERFRGRQERASEGEQRERRLKDGDKEREVAAAQIEVMRTALVALREGERSEWADVLNRTIRARSVRLRRLKGPQAKNALEREPKLEQTVEALSLAAELWREFRNQKNAGAVGRLARRLAASRESAKNERPRKRAGRQRLKQLEDEIAELQNALKERLGELRELERELDR